MRETNKQIIPKDIYVRSWIIEQGVPIVKEYKRDGIVLTLRGLHYQLVGLGFPNTIRHYKRVVGAMSRARWDGLLSFNDFVDHDRSVEGETMAKVTDLDDEIQIAQDNINDWATIFCKNIWENQPVYPEVFIEKKALQGVFEKPCSELGVALCPCKGYPSLTYLNLAAGRFYEAEQRRDQKPVILYFGDYDPSGEDIPRSIGGTLSRMGVDVEVNRIALMEDQVIEWGLPPAPTKIKDSRSATWSGIGQVELDAVEPKKLQKMVTEAIRSQLDKDLHVELLEQQTDERAQYRIEMKTFVQTLFEDE